MRRVDCIVCRVNLIRLFLLFLQHIFDWELPEDVPLPKETLFSPTAAIYGSCIAASTSTASYSDRITFFGFSSWQRRVCCLVDKSRGSQGLMNQCCRIADGSDESSPLNLRIQSASCSQIEELTFISDTGALNGSLITAEGTWVLTSHSLCNGVDRTTPLYTDINRQRGIKKHKS